MADLRAANREAATQFAKRAKEEIASGLPESFVKAAKFLNKAVKLNPDENTYVEDLAMINQIIKNSVSTASGGDSSARGSAMDHDDKESHEPSRDQNKANINSSDTPTSAENEESINDESQGGGRKWKMPNVNDITIIIVAMVYTACRWFGQLYGYVKPHLSDFLSVILGKILTRRIRDTASRWWNGGKNAFEVVLSLQMVRWVLELKAIRWILDKFRRRFMNGDEHVQPPSTAQSSSAAFNGAHDFPFDMRYSDQQYAYAENCVKVIEAMSAKEILQRLLECDSSDPYEILGVNHAATQAQVKKAYRIQSLKVHPDKAGTRAEPAFQKLAKAYTILGDPEKRFHMEREQQLREAMQREYDQFADRLDEFRQRYEEAELFMKCRCGELHPKTKTDRRTDTSRYVRERGAYVPTKDGDVWAETEFVFKWHFYINLDKNIYEVTDWAICQGLNRSIKPNAPHITVTVRPPKDTDSSQSGGTNTRTRKGGRRGKKVDGPSTTDGMKPEEVDEIVRKLIEEKYRKHMDNSGMRQDSDPSTQGKKKKGKKKK